MELEAGERRTDDSGSLGRDLADRERGVASMPIDSRADPSAVEFPSKPRADASAL